MREQGEGAGAGMTEGRVAWAKVPMEGAGFGKLPPGQVD